MVDKGAAASVEPPQEARDLLSNPNFDPSPNARTDLEHATADPRLVRILLALVERHVVEVSTIKTGHPMGPITPNGRPNPHYYGRAADITAVDGKPVRGNGADPDLVDVGRILRGIPPDRRPDEIMGPAAWQGALGYPKRAGFISDPVRDERHSDHLHVGFHRESGAANEE